MEVFFVDDGYEKARHLSVPGHVIHTDHPHLMSYHDLYLLGTHLIKPLKDVEAIREVADIVHPDRIDPLLCFVLLDPELASFQIKEPQAYCAR